jgi:hypothetical protein
MEQAVSRQHPAVVLRSPFNLVRTLLGIAMIAVVALTIAVVMLANDGDDIGGSATARPVESINYGGFNPATGRPDAAPLPQRSLDGAAQVQRYDGGPEEGISGVSSAAPAPAGERNTFPGLASAARQSAPADGTRYDGGPEEGTSGVTSTAPAPVQRYDGGPEEGTSGVSSTARSTD